MLETIIYIATTLLLPIIPAFLLYKTLPSTANVSGPFKGLNIQLSGSFGGYFLLVVVVIAFVNTRPKPPAPTPSFEYDVYRVEGRINLGDPGSTLNRTDRDSIIMSLEPPERSVETDGTFAFDIPVKHDQFGQADLPDLQIVHPQYEPAVIHLREENPAQDPPGYQVKFDTSSKRITVLSPIRLKRASRAGPVVAKADGPFAEEK